MHHFLGFIPISYEVLFFYVPSLLVFMAFMYGMSIKRIWIFLLPFFLSYMFYAVGYYWYIHLFHRLVSSAGLNALTVLSPLVVFVDSRIHMINLGLQLLIKCLLDYSLLRFVSIFSTMRLKGALLLAISNGIGLIIKYAVGPLIMYKFLF